MIFLKHLDFFQKMMGQPQFIGNTMKPKVLGEVKVEFIVIKISQVFQLISVTPFQQG
jgi:hypothetical protein